MKGVYLGSSGSVEIKRSSLNVPLSSALDADDVNVAQKRFSFDFDNGALITGDKIEIYTADLSTLELVANHVFPDWEGFISVDDAGGVRLYSSFKDAINADKATALELITPSVTQQILVRTVQESTWRFVSKVQNYSFTSSRDNIDLTSVGEEFRKQYASGLIGGQGSISCFWDYDRGLCDDDCAGNVELAQYFAELVLRTQQGSSFTARLNMILDGEDSVWWEIPIAIITNVAMAFVPGEPIKTNIEFVTSGEIAIRIGSPPGYLLQESSSFLLQEDSAPIALEDN